VLLVIFSLITIYSFSQTSAYLDFRNPVLESGVSGADGAQYRFSNVTTGVDAIVTITRRSDALVNILNADMNTSGFDGAFQPQVGYNNGTTPGAADWWMEFNIQFVNQGTTNPATIAEFNVSGVDIDGNGQYINEYLSFFDMHDYAIEAGSGLSVTNINENINGVMLSGRRFDGPVANYVNIDTSATMVMVTNHYLNKSSITVRTGGRSTDVSGAADRMYSFYFQNFAYNSPNNIILPLGAQRIKAAKKEVALTELNVYPNPSNGRINFKLPYEWSKSKVSFRVMDIRGNVVRDVKVNNVSNAGQIDISTLGKGVYTIQFFAGKESAINRVIVM
jgi:hypothetical protein